MTVTLFLRFSKKFVEILSTLWFKSINPTSKARIMMHGRILWRCCSALLQNVMAWTIDATACVRPIRQGNPNYKNKHYDWQVEPDLYSSRLEYNKKLHVVHIYDEDSGNYFELLTNNFLGQRLPTRNCIANAGQSNHFSKKSSNSWKSNRSWEPVAIKFWHRFGHH